MSELKEETGRVFAYETVSIRPEVANDLVIDIRPVVTDLDIFEHMDKPWLTGLLSFQDTSNLLAGIGVNTGDRVEIKIRRNEEPMDVFVHKFFRVDKIVEKIRKGQNENTQVVILHLVEEVWYESNAINVNKSYEGKPYQIIESILNSYLTDRDLIGPESEVQEMKVIVPNMTPLDAICWIKNRATTNEGFPLFLFSSLSHDSLVFLDLEYMLRQQTWNEKTGGKPFNNFQSSQSDKNILQRRTIRHFEQQSTNDFQKLINKGLYGARHQYLDVTTMYPHKIDYNHQTDINDKVREKGVSGTPLVSSHYKVHQSKLIEMQKHKDTEGVGNRVITQIGGTNAYNSTPSLNESNKTSFYKNVSVSRAMKTLLSYDSITVVVDGHDFTYDSMNTIGTLHTFEFKSTLPDAEEKEKSTDKLLSGNYIIYAAKHSFKVEGYDVTLTATKLTHGAKK